MGHLAKTRSGSALSGFYAYWIISSLLNLSVFALLLLPDYLKDLSWSSQKIGWTIGCFFLTSLILQAASGQIAEHFGAVRMALFGSGLSCVGALFYLASRWAPDLIFAGRIFHGAGSALVYTGALIQLTQLVPAHLKGLMIGYYGMPGFIMIGLGPVVSERLVYKWGFQGTFVLILVASLLTVVIVSRLPRRLTSVNNSKPHDRVFRLPARKLMPLLAFSISFGFCYSVWTGFLAPAIHSIGTGAVSSFGLAYAAGGVASRISVSHLLMTGQRRLAGVFTLVPYGLALAIIPRAGHIYQLLLLGLICGIAHGIYYPSLSSMAAERFDPSYFAQSMTLYVSSLSLGVFLGSPFWGTVADHTGYSFTFLLSGLLLVISTSVFLLVERGQLRGKSGMLTSDHPAASSKQDLVSRPDGTAQSV